MSYLQTTPGLTHDTPPYIPPSLPANRVPASLTRARARPLSRRPETINGTSVPSSAHAFFSRARHAHTSAFIAPPSLFPKAYVLKVPLCYCFHIHYYLKKPVPRFFLLHTYIYIYIYTSKILYPKELS